jgi:recombinational DNA repair protein RecR
MVLSKTHDYEMEALLEATGRTMAEIRPGEVCAKCKDDSACDECSFQPRANNQPSPKTRG